MDVLPADLIGQPVFVVRGRVELIERASPAIARRLVARRVVVFAERAIGRCRTARSSCGRRASDRPTLKCRRPPAIRAERPFRCCSRSVARTLPARRTPVVEDVSVPDAPASVRRLRVLRTNSYGSTIPPSGKSGKRGVGAIEIVASAAPVELIDLHGDDRRRKAIDPDLVVTKHARTASNDRAVFSQLT